MKTVVITSGYFNPIHPGHIECLELCKDLGDELRVIINNDNQAKQKTGKADVFQDELFRLKIVTALKMVDEAIISVDQDPSVCESIEAVKKMINMKYGDDVKIIFGKGGDRFSGNIPEVQTCKRLNIEIKDGLGSKTHNSSEYRSK